MCIPGEGVEETPCRALWHLTPRAASAGLAWVRAGLLPDRGLCVHCYLGSMPLRRPKSRGSLTGFDFAFLTSTNFLLYDTPMKPTRNVAREKE